MLHHGNNTFHGRQNHHTLSKHSNGKSWCVQSPVFNLQLTQDKQKEMLTKVIVFLSVLCYVSTGTPVSLVTHLWHYKIWMAHLHRSLFYFVYVKSETWTELCFVAKNQVRLDSLHSKASQVSKMHNILLNSEQCQTYSFSTSSPMYF